MPTSSSLSEFATDPGAFLDVAPRSRTFDSGRYTAIASATGKFLGVNRLRFPPHEAEDVLAELRELAPEAHIALSTPSRELADALRAAGCRDPKPPIEPSCTALATDREPPAVAGIDVKRVESFDEFLIGLDIELAGSAWTAEDEAARRSEARETYERRQARPGGEWLAYLDEEPVAWAGAVAGPRGLYLAGAATLPRARRRGAYRALVRARWDDAVTRGTPALVVHAQETSRPILERCGFERVATIYELEYALLDSTQ